jgi:hypothetical protein
MVERRHSDLKIDIKRRWILNAESDLAHLVEHSTDNRKVIGAIPIIETNGGVDRLHLLRFFFI